MSYSIIDCNLFDINKFNTLNELNKLNKLYNNKKFIFKTDPIKLTQYGIPNLNGTFIKDDDDRTYLKIPYDKSQQSCINLFNMLEKIDDLMQNNKNNMFGSLSNHYNYIPLIKKITNNSTNFPYCKVKFSQDSKTKNIITQVFKYSQQQNIKNVTDIASHLVWNSTAKFIISMNNIWITNSKSHNDFQDYGITLKCLIVEIIYEQQNNIIKCNSFVDTKLRISSAKEFSTNNISCISSAYLSYDYNDINKDFIFETGTIKFVQYGIPNIDGKFIRDDRDRTFMRIPNDPTQQSCKDLFDMLERIDSLIKSNKDQILGEHAHKYVYVPLVRKFEGEDYDQYTKKFIKLPYCKVKFCTDFNDVNTITTFVFKKDSNKKVYFFDDIKTVTDMTSHLMWGCVARFVVRMCKIWIDNKNFRFGIILICDQIEINHDFPIEREFTDVNGYYKFNAVESELNISETNLEKTYII